MASPHPPRLEHRDEDEGDKEQALYQGVQLTFPCIAKVIVLGPWHAEAAIGEGHVAAYGWSYPDPRKRKQEQHRGPLDRNPAMFEETPPRKQGKRESGDQDPVKGVINYMIEHFKDT